MSDYHAIYKDVTSPASLYDDPATTDYDESIIQRSIAIYNEDSEIIACCRIDEISKDFYDLLKDWHMLQKANVKAIRQGIIQGE